MNVFDRLARREADNSLALGKPAANLPLRVAAFAEMTEGRGFRTPKRLPNPARGERKRKIREQFRKTFKGEQRPLKHMHSVAHTYVKLKIAMRSRNHAAA